MARPFLIRLLALGAASLLQAAWMVLLARKTGVDAIGVYAIVTAWFMFASSVLGFGAGSYSLRLGQQTKDTDAIVTTMMLLRFGAVALISTACLTAILVLGTPYLPVAVLAIMSGTLESVSDLSQGVWSGRRNVLFAATLLVTQRAVPIAGILIDLASAESSFTFAIVGMIIAIAIACGSLLVSWVHPAPVRPTIASSRGFWGATVVSNLSQLDTPVVGLVADVSTASLYGAANRLTGPLNLVTTALLNVLVPELVAADDDQQRQHLFRRIRNIAALIAVALLMLAYPISLVALTLLGPQFANVGPFVIGFVAAAAVSGVSRTYQAGLFALDRAKYVTYGIVAGATVGLLLIVLLNAAAGPTLIAFAPFLAQLTVLACFVMSWRLASREQKQAE